MEQRINIVVPEANERAFYIRYSPPVLMKSGDLLYGFAGLYSDFKKEIEREIIDIRKKGEGILVNLLNVDRSPLIKIIRGFLERSVNED